MDSSASRRRRGPGFVTPNACRECRKKRTKCDGGNPCGRCASQGMPSCVYEASVRQSKEDMRSEIERLRRHQEQASRVFDELASAEDPTNLINQLRSGDGIENISSRLEASNLTLNSSEGQESSRRRPERYDSDESLSSVLNTTVSTPSVVYPPYEHSFVRVRDSGPHTQDNAIQFGQQVLLGDESEGPGWMSGHGPRNHNESWTLVTSDGELVEHLLALYFCWEYPIFASVSQEHFMEDFRKGHARYCSSLLINALLALACRFSDRPTTRTNIEDPTTAGDAFFAEASRLLNSQKDHHILTTVQALGVMSIREASCGRIKESSHLSDQSIRLTVEMGLHEEPLNYNEDDAYQRVCEATFWGALSLNEVHSLCTGRLPHLSQHVRFPSKPPIIPHVEDSLWIAYSDDGASLDSHFDQPSNLRSVYKIFCELSERVHAALYILYSPGSQLSSGSLVNLYNQYIQWYDTIPENLRLGHNFTPAGLFCHLYYHSATLLLFQPFINLGLKTSIVVPRVVCYQAANAVTGIIKSYSDLYTLRHTPSFVPYFALISTVIHLVALAEDSTSTGALQNLQQGMRDLEEMAQCHGFAKRAIEALQYLAQRWQVDAFPEILKGHQEFSDIGGRTTPSKYPDLFNPDVTILDMLQSIQIQHPIMPSDDAPLFTPFPMQGLPQVSRGTQLEEEGFVVAERKG